MRYGFARGASIFQCDSPPVVFSRVAAWLARHPRRAFRARSLIPSISSVLRTQPVYTLTAGPR